MKKTVFGIPDLDYLIDNLSLQISADVEIFFHSISISTKPNNLPSST